MNRTRQRGGGLVKALVLGHSLLEGILDGTTQKLQINVQLCIQL